MQVIIAEKPSVAREIAAIVRATNRKDGFIEGNGYVSLGLRPPGRAGNAPTVWHRGFPPGKPAYPAIIVHPPAPAGSGG